MPVTSLSVGAVFKGVGAVRAAYAAFERFYGGDPQALADLKRVTYDAWLEDLAAAVNAHEERLNDVGREHRKVEERIQLLEQSNEAKRIWLNLGFEALRESTDERRRMLAFAAVSLSFDDMPIEQKALVERRLRELDPVDVTNLFCIAMAVGKTDLDGKRHRSEGILRHKMWEKMSLSKDVLLSAGMVGYVHHSGVGVSHEETHVTDVGRLILKVLRLYLDTFMTSLQIPGRYPPITDSERDAAHNAVSSVDGLQDFFDWAAGQEHMGRQYLMPESQGQMKISSDGSDRTVQAPYIQINVFDDEKYDAMNRMAKGSLRAESKIKVYVSAQDNDGNFTLLLSAPHEILRVIASSDEKYWWIG